MHNKKKKEQEKKLCDLRNKTMIQADSTDKK